MGLGQFSGSGKFPPKISNLIFPSDKKILIMSGKKNTRSKKEPQQVKWDANLAKIVQFINILEYT